MTGLRGAHVLVTGASSGLGRAVALRLSDRGARLTLTGRDPQRLEELSAEVGGRVVVADLVDPRTRSLLTSPLQGSDLPDVVVHNAGAGLAAAAHLGEEDATERLFALNVFAPMAITRALLPGMTARGSGHLVFVTSIAGHLGVAGESAYAATKAALTGYAASLRDELHGTGVRVTTFAPGVVDTEFFLRRGVDYGRRLPRPMSADRVASLLVRALEADRAEVVVPRWLRLPVALRAAAPGMYARLSGRWGQV